MDIKDIADLLNKCIDEKNNQMLNNKYIEDLHAHLMSARYIGHHEIALVIKGIEIDDGLSTIYLFDCIRSLEYLKKLWKTIRENHEFDVNYGGKSYKFLCVAMNYDYKDKKMNDYQWSQIMEYIGKMSRKGNKLLFKYEVIYKEYFLDEVTAKTYLPDIKRIASAYTVYEQFVRFMRSVLESKYIRETKTNQESLNIIKSWFNTYLEDIRKKGTSNDRKKEKSFKDNKKDTIKQNNGNNEKHKGERVIVMINSENIDAVENEHENVDVTLSETKIGAEQINSQSTEDNRKIDENIEVKEDKKTVNEKNADENKAKIVKLEKTEQKLGGNQGVEKNEVTSIPEEVKQEAESSQEEVEKKTVDVANKKEQQSVNIQKKENQETIENLEKAEISFGSGENANVEENKKRLEKKPKKTKKKSEELKGLAEYFEKLELIAEENAKDLREKEKRIEELNEVISSKDSDIEELCSEVMKLKSELKDKSRSSEELTKKLEESMEMNLAFETIKATREESLKKDIADSLRNIYEDYINSIDENIDIELGEIYREKIGEVFQILEKDGVKVEL